jgi:electron transport complex protein RnfG
MIFSFLRRPRARRALFWLLTLLPLAWSGRAAAQATYYTPRALLGEFFPKSQLVTNKKYDLSAEQRVRIEQKLGYTLPKSAYTFYIAKTGDTIDGYAILDEELGQHLPISYGVKLSPRGIVERQEILVYRERYGDEVRDPRFREQFVGKSAADSLRPGEEIVAVSGATISSRAMAIGVRRCLVLLDELVLRPQRS